MGAAIEVTTYFCWLEAGAVCPFSEVFTAAIPLATNWEKGKTVVWRGGLVNMTQHCGTGA